MPSDTSLERPPRITSHSGTSFVLWGLSIVAIITAGVLGYVARPLIETESATNEDNQKLALLVKSHVGQAVVPIDASVKELKQLIESSDQGSRVSTEDMKRLSTELGQLRSHIDKEIGRMEQAASAQEAGFRTQINETIFQINEKLAKVDALATSVDQLVATDVPNLQNEFKRLKETEFRVPGEPGGPGQTDTAGGTQQSGGAADNTSGADSTNAASDQTGNTNSTGDVETDRSLGKLVINNTTASEFSITINGQPQLLIPGENTFRVPLQEVNIAHPRSSLNWQLDASMWENTADGYVIRRKWSM